MKKILLLFIMVTAMALHANAQKMVSGIVRDSIDNSPLVGATILIKGTTIGTISDLDGKFQLQPPSGSTLIVSFIGYKPKVISYTGQTSLDIIMVPDLTAIDEVVVVAYGTQRKSHLTGAVSSIKNDRLDEVPVVRADQALQGKSIVLEQHWKSKQQRD